MGDLYPFLVLTVTFSMFPALISSIFGSEVLFPNAITI